jgi:hypothetical protein
MQLAIVVQPIEVENFLSNLNKMTSEKKFDHFFCTISDRLESYVSFCDLCYVLQHSNERVWHTFGLKGETWDQVLRIGFDRKFRPNF